MDQNITNTKLSFICDENWDSMSATSTGKFCAKCNHAVYDLSNKNANYFLEILKENPQGFCGRFSSQQLVKKSSSFFWKQWLSAAILFMGLSTLSERLNAQEKPSDQSNKDNFKKLPAATLGMVMSLEPEFIGGKPAFHKFILKNFWVPPRTPNGIITAKFIVNDDGSVTDVRIMKGLNEGVDAELIRVLKLSPKWVRPAISSSVITTITIKKGKLVFH